MPKVILAKIGIDGHDRGFRLVAAALRDAGFEVVLMGPWSRTEDVVKVAIEEDADVIGVSTLVGDYVLIPKLMGQLKEKGMVTPVVVGGIIPPVWELKLKEIGVAKVFHPGTSLGSIVSSLKSLSTGNVRQDVQIK